MRKSPWSLNIGPRTTDLAPRTLSAGSQCKVLIANVSPVLVLVPQTALRPNTSVYRPHNLGSRQRLPIHPNADVLTSVLSASNFTLVTPRPPNKSTHAALKILKELIQTVNIRLDHHRFLVTV